MRNGKLQTYIAEIAVAYQQKSRSIKKDTGRIEEGVLVMKKKFMLAMLAAVMIGLAGCGQDEPATGDVEIPAQEIDPAEAEQLQDEIDQSLEDYDADVLREGYLDYSMELFRRSVEEGANSMISPTSVMMALDMTAAGAKGTTQEQMVNLFCDSATQAQMEHYCKDLMERYNSSEGVKLHLANSIWINDSIADRINEDYLVRTDYIFDATASVLPFDENATDLINDWCDEHTDGMISKLFDKIDPEAQMYLINAAAIDAPWQEPYEDSQVREETFTNAAGGAEDVKMLNGMETGYFETEDAVGFMKYYEGYDYAFLAILPNEDISVDEYVQSLTGEKYEEFWNSRTQEYDVYTKLPEFTYEYGLYMKAVLEDMGMTQAFGGADFTGIADADLYIDEVIHKTFIEVGQYRTLAAAVTAVEMEETAAVEEPRETREVYLDRPFIYAIVEADTGAPLFIGTLQTVG